MASKGVQHVLCFKRELLDRLGSFQGISLDVARYFPAIVAPENCGYVPRPEAEIDPSRKQVIPYVLFVHEDRVFAYRRGKKGSETRLRELYSIGIGGHIDAPDTTLFNTSVTGYHDALRREVNEEVEIAGPWTDACAALINDDSNDVGRVHFGVVHVARLSSPVIRKREVQLITDAGLVPLAEAARDASHYETWSQLCLSHIDEILKAASEENRTL
jgi:predicted NUDIX family phosphoesterase